MTAQLRTEPPQPALGRWQPLRCGLVELFHYDAEEFWFRDGRLLLRGNNGTGKSKVLALTLPFLFDGDHRPHRLEPDGDVGKRMEWNLLLGGQHTDRIGYAWVEFGRRDDAGAPHYVTLGCGLKAVAGKGIADKWFFVTSQRVGADLHLVDANRLVLGKDRLRDTLGEAGQLFEGVEAYRRAVDERLFRLGPERYSALIDLLVQLRQPQLSKRPDEQALSRALTEALPPIDQSVVTHVAEALRALEQDREQLAELAEARRAIGSFADRYRTYAAVATKRRAAGVRRTTYAYEETGRKLGAVEDELREAGEREQRLRAERAEAERRLDGLRAAERTLRSSPEMRDAARLEQAADRLARAREAAAHAVAEWQRAETSARDRRRAAAEAQAALEQAREHARAVARSAADAAAVVGVRAGHRDMVEPAVAAALEGPGGRQTLPEADATALAARRAEAVVLVRRLATAALDAERERGMAAAARDDLASQRDAAGESVSAAEHEHAATATAHIQAVETYAAQTRVLALENLDEVLSVLQAWVADPDGADPATSAIERAGRTAAHRLAAAEERLSAQAGVLAERNAELEAERDRVAAGAHPIPPRPHSRSASQDGRAGAPLWQVVEFADHLSAADRAGLEAALEAAGLLDAWVTPDGGLLDPGDHDVAVTAGAPAGRSLAGVLRPAENAPVPAVVVQGVLEGIGLGPATADSWMDPSGRFRLGVAEGRWGKQAATYIGEEARAAARGRRLAELDAERDDLAGQADVLERQQAELASQVETLDAELGAAPSDSSVRAAATTLAARREELVRAGQRLAEADTRLERLHAAAESAAAERDTTAASLDLPADPAALDDVAEAVQGYRVALAALWPTLAGVVAAGAHATAAAAALAEADETVTRSEDQLRRAGGEQTAAESEHATLEQLVGAAVAEVQARLEETVRGIDDAEAVLEELGERVEAAHGDVRAADANRETLQGQLAEHRGVRAGAVEDLRRLAATGVVAAALSEVELPDIDEPWAADPAVRLARDLDRLLGEVDDSDQAWERTSTAISGALTELQRALSVQGASAEGVLRHDTLVVTVRYRQLASSPLQAVGALDDDVAWREQLLDAREREILENHLVADVATQLSRLVSDAQATVDRMNGELKDRPTTTGMVLQLRWRPDADRGPAGLAEARQRLLQQAAVMWSQEDREVLGRFLKAEIDRVRAEDDTATWFEQLSRAFDYRRWHHFVVERKQGDGSWRRASGPASGGERVLAATVPLFAAASAHYASADPHAPRLVLLDEAFAGVDDAARRQCMSLLTTFELDCVLTSEREWGCYREVPGLSICQLSRFDGIDAVHVSRWEWDGRTRHEVEHDHDSAIAAPRSQTGVGTLFTP